MCADILIDVTNNNLYGGKRSLKISKICCLWYLIERLWLLTNLKCKCIFLKFLLLSSFSVIIALYFCKQHKIKCKNITIPWLKKMKEKHQNVDCLDYRVLEIERFPLRRKAPSTPWWQFATYRSRTATLRSSYITLWRHTPEPAKEDRKDCSTASIPSEGLFFIPKLVKVTDTDHFSCLLQI